jgi:ATP-dependent Zn protease
VEQQRLLATHETGHAVVTLAVAGERLKPMFLTIERYGKALGHMYPVETFKWYLGRTKEMLEAAICISLAGAAAEDVIANSRHDSLGGDLPNVWALLEIMEFNGMLGVVPLGKQKVEHGIRSWDFAEEKESAKRKREKLDELWERTKLIIDKNKHLFPILIDLLVERKSLTSDEIIELVDDKIVRWPDEISN